MERADESEYLKGRIAGLEMLLNALLVGVLKDNSEVMGQLAGNIRQMLDSTSLESLPEGRRNGIRRTLSKAIETLSRQPD